MCTLLLALDGLFPLAYGLLSVGHAARLRARSVGGRAPLLVMGAAVVAAVADQVEDVAMVPTLLGLASATNVQVTLAAAVVKLTAFVIALVGLTVLLVHVRGDADLTVRGRRTDAGR